MRTIPPVTALGWIALMGFWSMGALPAAAGTGRLPEGMAEAAEKAVAFINAQGYGNVGVLKFRVQKQGADVGGTVGTINRDLAAQLETALVIKRKQPATFVLLADASDTAAAMPGAGDATPEAREKLFAARYRPAWGDAADTVAADAFITGFAEVDSTLTSMRVKLLAVDRSEGGPREIAAFDAVVEPALLGPLGESFASRGMLNAGLGRIGRQEGGSDGSGSGETAESHIRPIAANAASIRDGDKPHPLADSSSPVTLTVAYDGKEVPLEYRDGRAFVPEPKEGQKVTLTVRKRNRDGRQIGVVLKVNGENTAMRETLPDLQCYKWILSDRVPFVNVRGYQIDRETVQPFTVLSGDASRQREFDYGANVGTISVTAFDDEASAPPTVAAPASLAGQRSAADIAAVSTLERGVRIDSVAANGTPQQLREALVRGSIDSTCRGLIVEGNTTEKRNLDLIEFKPLPIPAMVGVVSYYEPSGKSGQ
jgi:hypothetical protein